MMNGYPEPIERLVRSLSRLPGIGPKSAVRIAFHLLKSRTDEVEEFASALRDVKERVIPCPVCGNPCEIGREGEADRPTCSICKDQKRDVSQICVVEEPRDVAAFERMREYRGLYHVLYGALSPLDGINPEDLKIKELLNRLQNDTVKEVIIATDPTVEGEATAVYLARLIKPLGIKVSRLAMGIPVGSDIDYTDDVTLAHSLEGRRSL